MDAIKAFIPLLLSLSLAGLVLTVGLNSGKGELFYVLRRPALLARVILAVLIVPPVAAALLLWVLPLAPAVKAGIMLMAVAPVPPLVPGKELKAGASKEFAYGVYVAMVLLTVISVPLVFTIAAQLFGVDAKVPMSFLFSTVAFSVLLPLAIGALIRRMAPAFADRAGPLVFKLSSLLVVVAFLPIIVSVWPAIADLIGNGTLLAMAAAVVICLAVGHWLGGPDRSNRATLAVAASVRHPGIAMSLAGANFADRHVQAAVLLFMLVGMVVGTLYNIWLKRTAPAGDATAAT